MVANSLPIVSEEDKSSTSSNMATNNSSELNFPSPIMGRTSIRSASAVSPIPDDNSVVSTINKNKSRNRHVHTHFIGELPEDQICVADFTCALERKGLIRHGRLYITQEYIAFHSPIANTKLLLHFRSISKVIPKNTLIFPSAIVIEETAELSHHFMSFIYRGNALNTYFSPANP